MPDITITRAQNAKIRTKKYHEKVIGAKFNSNDEINHIAQQEALINLGLAMLGPGGGNTGKKGSQVRK